MWELYLKNLCPTLSSSSLWAFSNAKQDFFSCCTQMYLMFSVGGGDECRSCEFCAVYETSGQQVIVLKRNSPDFSGSLSSSMVCFMASLCCWKLFPVENK